MRRNMGNIRPLTSTDIPAVATLFQHAFRRSQSCPPPSLVDYLHDLYVTHPACDEAIPALVHEGPEGLSGFVGRHGLSMEKDERPVRGALLSTIMTDDRGHDPLVGAKLLRAALAGPQDFSFTETASEVSLHMWQRAGGMGLASYSLNWIRIIRPLQWAADQALTGRRFLAPLKHLAGKGDNLFRSRIRPERPRWLALSKDKGAKAAVVRTIDEASFAGLFGEFAARFALRPGWQSAMLEKLVGEAILKPDFGSPVLAAVTDHKDRPIGCFFYHLRPGSAARVIQMLSAQGHEGAVIDALIADAAERGAAGVTGRTQPYLMEAMLGRRIAFTNTSSSVIHTRNDDIRAVVTSGAALLNGIAGEQWSRLIGGRFE